MRPSATPTIVNPLLDILPQALQDNIEKFAFNTDSQIPAPPCKQQPPFRLPGRDLAVPAREAVHRRHGEAARSLGASASLIW